MYDKLKGKFNCTAFVPVGRNPDLKKVFRDILIDLDKQQYMDFKFTILDERQLINELQNFLETKRCVSVATPNASTQICFLYAHCFYSNMLFNVFKKENQPLLGALFVHLIQRRDINSVLFEEINC